MNYEKYLISEGRTVKAGGSRFNVEQETSTLIAIRSMNKNWFVYYEGGPDWYHSANLDVNRSVGWAYKKSKRDYPEFILNYAGHIKAHHTLPKGGFNVLKEAQTLFEKAEAISGHQGVKVKDYVDMLRAMSYAEGQMNET